MDPVEREPYTKISSSDDSLNDFDITSLTEKLKNLKSKDFFLKSKFENIKSSLNSNELRSLKISKLLYCLDFKKEVFLFLGIILESRLNYVIKLYKEKKWQTPQNFNNNTAQDKNFNEFIIKKSLGEKANFILNFNIFNDISTSGLISKKLEAMSILRNYGGHSKNINQFLENIIKTDRIDSEIEDAFNVIKHIKSGIEHLISGPPAILSLKTEINKK